VQKYKQNLKSLPAKILQLLFLLLHFFKLFLKKRSAVFFSSALILSTAIFMLQCSSSYLFYAEHGRKEFQNSALDAGVPIILAVSLVEIYTDPRRM
jgi:hypothetical protein